ncbi:DUF3144 domain-containing protein [Dokdonella sp.]|uniref:DUF3144 domain-containing protein n=1 Tax=Dokdonella sp. TaxID=2291710 RepID=UPI003526E40F
MAADIDDEFYNRADAVIYLANEQVEKFSPGKVSASCMYATARFNAWVTACGCSSSLEMRAERKEAIEYFTKQDRAMLEENLDDYINKFAGYMQPEGPD